MQVQDQSGPAETQNQAMEVQDPPSPLVHPREDAYCILQMLLHLTLPLTEVLASLPEASPRDPSLGLLERVDSSTVRDVLGVLADFDPAMAFTVIQGLGWGHTVLEVSREKEDFGQQLIALAEALLDCKKFWQCRVLLSHLLAYEVVSFAKFGLLVRDDDDDVDDVLVSMSGVGVFLGGQGRDEHGFRVVLHDEEGAGDGETLGMDGYGHGGEGEMES
ncbi:uncharacterized protein LOC105445495 [Strongylocentrotus purpuratus]|uniref:Uncharacterized protein n=1 Tax=Strongylocentrotus purpuratus TaxID=7668 RepID=A0A7M7NW72_STRPU|nr:uncharacterized protein LOC105445495 [Strongylocentrotus purpuratus]